MITELVAIKAALAYYKLSKCKKVHIYMDSLCAIYAIQNLPPKENIEIINNIIQDIAVITVDRELYIHPLAALTHWHIL